MSAHVTRASGIERPGGSIRAQVLGIYLALGGANLLAWAWAIVALHDRPVLLGTAALAYSFGVRHAFDPDHIAAIDNVTRKLMQEDKQPLTVGLWFSLGHSTMVVLTSLVVALTASTLRGHFEPWREVAEVVATGVSAGFLFAIAAVNIVILGTVFRSFQAARRTGGPRQVSDEAFGGPRGLLARALRPLFRLMTESWHMYPLGFLFALGLETATEIALFSISGAEASRGLSNWTVLVFPVLFAAGMSLVGATNGIMMVGVYGWAFVKPIRKLYYNVAITLASVLVAMLVGSIEVLGLIAEKFELKGVFWRWVADLNQDVGTLSYTVFGIFGVSWVISALVYKIKRYDEAQGSLARDDAITGMIQARRVR